MREVPPDGLTLSRLEGEGTRLHAASRLFCLETIKEFYGFEYNPDWHGDIDTLLLSEPLNHYSRLNRGAFWTLTAPDGTLVATAGVRGLSWKPGLVRAFAARYPRPELVASIWRVYVRRDRRGRGLGLWLNGLAEAEAAGMGYDTMYLHASSNAAATIAFWKGSGYAEIDAFDVGTTHFDKPLRAASVAAA